MANATQRLHKQLVEEKLVPEWWDLDQTAGLHVMAWRYGARSLETIVSLARVHGGVAYKAILSAHSAEDPLD